MVGEDVRDELNRRGYRLKFYFSDKFPIDLNRNEAFDVCTSNQYEADLIMCCDGDQRFKKDTLLKLLEAANEAWLTPDEDISGVERPPVPFHVLFQCTADKIDEVAQRFAAAGFGFERIVAVLQDTMISVRTM